MVTKTKKEIWILILKIIAAIAAAILGVLGVQSCTMSMSIAKNNNNATQQTEQKATSEVKNDSINLKF
nr:MAG TPA: hypothetical protein [Bacteriophage sp.]